MREERFGNQGIIYDRFNALSLRVLFVGICLFARGKRSRRVEGGAVVLVRVDKVGIVYVQRGDTLISERWWVVGCVIGVQAVDLHPRRGGVCGVGVHVRDAHVVLVGEEDDLFVLGLNSTVLFAVPGGVIPVGGQIGVDDEQGARGGFNRGENSIEVLGTVPLVQDVGGEGAGN